MDKITSPYIDTEQYSRIALNSYQMDTDILINIKFNLIKKVENKCNKNGYIVKVYKILENKNGIIHPENFNATAIFDIKYSCKLCMPIESTTIICQIRNINKVLMVAENGPILAIILSNNINMENFKYNSTSTGLINIKTKKELLVSDYIKINIISKTFNFGDNQIKIMAYLEDVATESEVSTFFNQNISENEEEDNYTENYNTENNQESNFII